MNEVLLYGPIWQRSAVEFLQNMAEVDPEGTLSVRVNTEGGEPAYAWGMISKFLEHAGPKHVKVDGQAYSAGTFFCCYADAVEALDVSQFLVHRAAYSEWFEKSEYFTAALRSNLENINKSLKKAFVKKVDVKKFEELKGVKVKDIFNMNDSEGNVSRVDVFLTAKEAKAIGLIDKVTKITPTKKAEIESVFNERIAALGKVPADLYAATEAAPAEEESPTPAPVKESLNKNKAMTIDEFKVKHPEAFAALSKDITAQVLKAERDRVGAWMAWQDVDPKAVAEGIKSGDAVSMTQLAEFQKKMLTGKAQADATAENAANVETGAAPSTEEENAKPEVKAIEESVLAELTNEKTK